VTIAASLTAEELRVLACLIEKSHTTPDQYPLSSNALTAACNQKTSRDPVVDYPVQLVDRTLQLLRDGGWARMKRPAGSRAFKHFHVIDEKLGLDVPQQAVLAVLALRGPQSAGELRTRTERYHPFADPADVEEILAGLAHRPEPLVRNVGRAAGQSQDRWVQLLGPETTEPSPAAPRPAAIAATPTAPTPAPPTPSDGGEVAALRARVEALETRLAVLERELGLDGA
jgi:uncharacterized protein YceH (UPF0502 family)